MEQIQKHTRRPMENAYCQCSMFSMVPSAQVHTTAQSTRWLPTRTQSKISVGYQSPVSKIQTFGSLNQTQALPSVLLAILRRFWKKDLPEQRNRSSEVHFILSQMSKWEFREDWSHYTLTYPMVVCRDIPMQAKFQSMQVKYIYT